MLATRSIKNSVRKLAVDILEKIFADGLYADEALANSLAVSKLNQRDRSLLVELVNGTVRWRGQLDWILRELFHGRFDTSPLRLRAILEVSLYQLKFLDKIPSYAAVSEAVELAKILGGQAWGRLVNGVLRSYLRDAQKFSAPPRGKNLAAALAIQYSHPQWMLERWLARYDLAETERLCECNNRRPLISVRINPAKTTRALLLKKFEELGMRAEPSKFFDDFILLHQPDDVSALPLFQQGWFAIQDESTAIPCRLLSPQKGETILDICAAPGGKSCYLAHLVEDDARIIAVDRNPKRLRLLQQNVARFNLKSIRPVVADGASLTLKPVDKILLDAPCSGLGVLARRSDVRWKRTLDDITNIQKLQRALLENAHRLLKPGGALVYCTCTIEPEENEMVVRHFLEEHKNYEIEMKDANFDSKFFSADGFFRTLPQRHAMDGSFAVKLIKTK
jgi:16S rRNA (cytosine967-C5)-methyltransferase